MLTNRWVKYAGIVAVTLGTVSVSSLCFAGESLRTEKVVVLMRHGVRPQTSLKEVAPLSTARWPDWGVGDGMLTPHGALAAARLGAWEGQWLVAQGILNAPYCPSPGDVFAWSSRELRRTTDTGYAFLDAMFPGCRVPVGRSPGSGADPLYTAIETDVGKLDLAKGEAAILEAMGGSFEKPKAQLTKLHEELQRVLNCCQPEFCEEKHAAVHDCKLTDLPWKITPTADRRGLKVDGPMSLAATVSQIFLLEYAGGLAKDQIAWGKVTTAADVLHFSEMRRIKYEYYDRVPYLARRGSSNMLAQLTLALAEGTGIDTGLRVSGPPPAKYVIYFGSDTQIVQIATMLGLRWLPKSYLADETPPTGGLIFQRLVDTTTGKRSVRISFVTPTLEQIRTLAVLDAANPPEILPLDVPSCRQDTVQGACPLSRFVGIVRDNIDDTAIATPDYGG